jgi:uncharacterized protein (DUF1330 family)
VLLAVFVGWYARGGEPLGQIEIDRYLDVIAAQTQRPGGQHDFVALRSFLESDDGQPFYIVNLYDFHDEARYLEAPSPGGTGSEAFDRFGAVMFRLLVRHGSHPIFSSSWVAPQTPEWDRIVIVRYRSRRDLVDIFASREFADAATHKWAAIARNGRTLVRAQHLPELVVPAFSVALVSSALGWGAWLAWPRRARGAVGVDRAQGGQRGQRRQRG